MGKKYRHEAFGIGIAVADPRISESGKEIVDLEFCDCRRSILLCVLELVDDSATVSLRRAGVANMRINAIATTSKRQRGR